MHTQVFSCEQNKSSTLTFKGQVLTGDKMETAVTISLSCNLLADSMHLFLLPDVLGKSVGQLLCNMLDEARRHFDDKLAEGQYRRIPSKFRDILYM